MPGCPITGKTGDKVGHKIKYVIKYKKRLFPFMRNYLVFTVICLSFIVATTAQPDNKTADNAFVITRMVEKFHIQPRPVNKDLSADWFDLILQSLDDEKIFFIKEDINRLLPYRLLLDEEVLHKKTGFLRLLTSIYQLRIQQVDTMIDHICKIPFNFNLNETYTRAEDTSYPLNSTAQRIKLYKSIKLAVLNDLLEITDSSGLAQQSITERVKDSLESTLRKKMQTSFKRSIKEMLQSPEGLTASIGNTYCSALANCFDPHTEFFPLTEKENFESQLGNKPLRFGFTLKQAPDGGTVISNLKPGSPAFKSGQLNKDDKILTIQWQGREIIDVSDATLSETAGILDASNHDKITITVKKADGSTRQVSLLKEKDETDDDAGESKVKSFLLKGSKTIGFISLPSFYADWENNHQGLNGCADDVAKEILKLKKENIEGLIIDLRFNGGGSMNEATELAGIFIDAGPVEQIQSRDPKILTLKDVNRGTIYDGPLILMVNGNSASASEMLAGTLQDYNRAVIAGSTTYGKATAQVVLPMDTTFNPEVADNKTTDSYLKITVERLYRITGNTAQVTGVIPDIVLPDLLEADPQREKDNKLSLKAAVIEPNKYYQPYPPIPLTAMKAAAKTITDTSSFFKAVKKYVLQYRELQQPQSMPLRWADAREKRKMLTLLTGPLPEFTDSAKAPFTIGNHYFEEQRLKTDDDLREMNEEWKDQLRTDPYIQAVYQLILLMIK
jgi:carboxyl-terminal processing protease